MGLTSTPIQTSVPSWQRRRTFDPDSHKFCEVLIKKHFFHYPSLLCVVVDGKQQRFSCHKGTEAAFMPTSASPG